MKNTVQAFAFLLCFLIPGLLFAQPTKAMLSLDDYADYEWASNPRISPDGKQVIYSRGWINLMDDKRETDLWIMNADGSQNRFFLNGSNGRWSPDGTRVAFTKKGEPDGTQIFVKYLGVEGDPTQITKLEKSPSSMTWSPDGKYIAFTMHVADQGNLKIDIPAKPKGAKWTKPPAVIDQVTYRRDRVGYYEQGFAHIFVVPADGGTARQITSGDWNHRGSLSWTPDSKKIVFSSLRIPEADYAYRESNLYSVEVGTGQIDQLTDRKGQESQAIVSPDGKQVAFVGSLWTENFYHARELFVMDLESGKFKSLTNSLDRTPSGIRWAGDNSGIYFTANDHGTRNFYHASLAGEVKKVTDGKHMLTVTDMNKEGQAVGILTDPHNPPDVVSFNVNRPKLEQLTDVNSDILDFVQLGTVEEVNYKSTDGTDVQGWLVKPPDFDPNKKYPLILRIHGGPHSMYHVGFNFTFQVHAAEGALVLYTNPRGSTGYGYDFANAIQNAYPGNDYDDLMKGVDEVISRGYIDEEKLYVYGGSGGGVLTSWIIGHTDRFAAASVNYPVTNWFSFVGTTDGIGWYRNFEHYPWEDPTEHIRRSPLSYVGNVSTPTMLMCGVKDLRTPISQTEEYYQALKVNKVPAVMLRFNDEYHGTTSNPSNFLRTVGYLRSWFGKYPETGENVKP